MPTVYEKKTDGTLWRIFGHKTKAEAQDHIKWLKSEDRNKGRKFIIRKNPSKRIRKLKNPSELLKSGEWTPAHAVRIRKGKLEILR